MVYGDTTTDTIRSVGINVPGVTGPTQEPKEQKMKLAIIFGLVGFGILYVLSR